MKYANTQKAFVPTGARESVPPYGVTRDYTDEEVHKSPELRYAIERGYLVPFDPKKHNSPLLKAADPRAPKKTWVDAPDNLGGQVKTIKSGGKTVEYIMADAEGVDGISNPGEADMVAAIDGQKSVDFIEEGLDASKHEAAIPAWKTASDRFEEDLKAETTQDLDYDDEDTLSEGEAEREEIPDADEEIEKDFGSIITPPIGNMGATETTTRELVKESMAKGTAALAEAVKQNFDDAEVAPAGTSPEVTDFLAQNFSTKKWAVSKETNKDFLAEVSLVTKSENVRSLADQRLTELG